MAKPEVDFNGQAVADRFIYCINVELEVGYREFVHAVSAIFLLPVWPETAVSDLFSPVMRLCVYYVAWSPADWRRVLRRVSRLPEYYFRFNGK